MVQPAPGLHNEQVWYEYDCTGAGRGIKERYYPMLGFGEEESAARFISAFEEQRQYFRFRQHKKEVVSLSERRQHFKRQFYQLRGIFTKFKTTKTNSVTTS